MKRLLVIFTVLFILFFAFTFFELKHIIFALILVLALVAIGIRDFFQQEHTILRNFPVIGHFRYMLEFIRPEIQQYFIASNQNERPFSRERRNLVYQRAKCVRDTAPFGTQRDIEVPEYDSIRHSMSPTIIAEPEARVLFGLIPETTQPYLASRLNISAMSFGSLSPNAVLALNKGAKLGNFLQNTGEGGLSRYHLEGGGALTWQLGTAYFGCRDKNTGAFAPELFKEKSRLENVKMIEIKLSQGAKPSHGGILPMAKITPEIAEIRGIRMDVDCVQPACHSEFSTPIGLLEFVRRLRELSGGKPVGFKLCIGYRHEFLGICKAMLLTGITPDFITIDSADGGTGAAPIEFTNRVGEHITEALLFVHNALVGVNLRDKIRVVASGKVASGFDMIFKIALGADTCNAARSMMFALGCIQSLQCNANTCPTGITTQNPYLIRGLVVEEKYKRVANFHKATLHSMIELAQAMGVQHLDNLNASHIYHQIHEASCRTYAELFDELEPGTLLGNIIPESFFGHWTMAKADAF